jgi:hypothetical protein
VCAAALWAPDNQTVGRKRCPRCGADLWVLAGADGPVFFVRQPGQSRYQFLAALAGPLQGVPVEEMEVALRGADSLDLVELVLEIEEALKAGTK